MTGPKHGPGSAGFPVLLPAYRREDVLFVRGEGAYLEAADGRRFLDFGSGVAVNALGHAHPHLVRALTEQAGRVWHLSNLYRIEGQERLARRLVEASFADTVFFCNSGAEAVECAIKMARRFHAARGAGERYRLVTFEGAFHGRTLATIAAGGQAKYLEGFGPPVEGFDQVPFGDHEALKAAIGRETAGILIEPIQGEGGVREVPAQCLRGLRELCDANGILLILDEVQTGMGRTGRLFAHEWAGVRPDIMALAKGLGGGFPIGACLATAQAGEAMGAGSHGSTFGGNPLAMAVGNAVLDVMLAEGFLEQVLASASHLRQGLAGLSDRHGALIGAVRGRGLLLGIECRIPVDEIRRALFAQGLLAVNAGDNVLRIMPPLVAGAQEIGEGLARIEAGLAALKRDKAP